MQLPELHERKNFFKFLKDPNRSKFKQIVSGFFLTFKILLYLLVVVIALSLMGLYISKIYEMGIVFSICEFSKWVFWVGLILLIAWVVAKTYDWSMSKDD